MFVVYHNEKYWLEDNRIPVARFDLFKRENPNLIVKITKDKKTTEVRFGELEDYKFWRE